MTMTNIDEAMNLGELRAMLSVGDGEDYDAQKIDTTVREVLTWMRHHYEEGRNAYAVADVLDLVMDMIAADGSDGLDEATVNSVLVDMGVILINIEMEGKTLSPETRARLKQMVAVLHGPAAERASDAPPLRE
jgi:hypothetical protein